MTYHASHTWTKQDEGRTVRELLKSRLQFSSRLIRTLKVGGGVFVNGEPVRMQYRGREGEVLQVRFPEERSDFEAEPIPLDIAYEDDDLIIINKQPGIVTHPTKNYQSGTLANALTYEMKQRGTFYKVRFVNRLDRDTSGLVIVAKNAHGQKHIADQMERDEITKRYIALVGGQPSSEEGCLDGPIARNPDHVARRMVSDEGRACLTKYEVLERIHVREGYALLGLTLLTGRTHQIRVHCAHEGWPIVGDDLYGGQAGCEAGCEGLQRQALHASELSFSHPMSGERICVNAPLPDDMKRCLESLRLQAVREA